MSWCPGQNDPCDPCKHKTGTTVSTTSGGWYVVVFAQTYVSGAPGTGIQVLPGTMVWVGDGGATTGTPSDPLPGIFPVWVAVERNVLYDTNPYYAGYQIGQFSTYQYAEEAAATTLAQAQPIQTAPIIVAVGPGTGHPPGT